MADIAKMVARLELQASQFQTGMEKAQKQVDRFRRETTTSLGKIQSQFADFGRNILRTFAVGSLTTAVYGLTRAVSESLKAGNDLAKFAQKSGLAAEAASELAHAANNAEISLETLGKGIRFMQTNLSKIGSKDGKEAAEILDAIGLSAESLKRLAPEDQFLAIGDAIKRLPNIEDQTRAWQFFGKAGLELAPAFEDGADGIRKAMEEAKKLGKSFTAEDLAKFQAADDAFDRLSAAGSGLANVLAINLAPSIVAVTEGLTKLLSFDFDKSDFFAFVTAPPSQKLILLTKMLNDAGDAAQAVSSGPTGRVLPGLKGSTPLGFIPEPAKIKEVTAEMERFANQAAQIRNDLAGAFNSISPSIADSPLLDSENTKAIAAAMEQIRGEVIELGEAYEETEVKVSVFAEQAARNMQDAFSEFFMDFDGGLKGMAESFLKTLQSMVANLAASELLSFIGGGLSGSSNGFLASLGTAMSVPGRASGGPVSGGKPYMVGERGPELFVPGASGTIVPGGGGTVIHYAPVINAQGADAELRRRLPDILQQNNVQLVRVLQDQRSRGAF